MPLRALPSGERTASVYCVVAADTDESTLAALRAHLGEHEITLVVDQRTGERRNAKRARRRPRRLLSGRHDIERRSIHHAHGRRVAERRAEQEPGPVALLPRELVANLDRSSVRFVVATPADPEAERDVAAARLVIRYQSGDRDAAFAELYHRYAEPVRRFARAALRDPHEAEDISQQVFMKVATGLPSYELRSTPFRGWLFHITRNCVIDRLRRSGRVQLFDPAALGQLAELAGSDATTRSLDWITCPQISGLVDSLPGGQRDVLVLRYAFGCSHAEVADLLGRTEASVRQSHHVALRGIQAALDYQPERLPALQRVDQPMRAAFIPRRLALAGFTRAPRAF